MTNVIIVGGGIAGCVTAGLLAKQGIKVDLIERQLNRISNTISSAIFFPDSMEIFDEINFGKILDEYNFPKIKYISFEFQKNIRISGYIPMYKGRNWAYAIQRKTIDRLLLNHIKECKNITLHQGVVENVIWQNNKVSGVKMRLAGSTRAIEMNSSYVIGADGKFSSISNAVEAPLYHQSVAKTCVYYAYFLNVKPYLSDPSFISYHGTDPFNFHGFTQDSDEGLTCVGIEAPIKNFNLIRKNPEKYLLECINNIPDLKSRMLNAQRATAVVGIRIPGMYYKQPYGDGWLLVGDSGLLMDPITGQGFNNATHSAKLIDEAFKKLHATRNWKGTFEEYKRQRDKFTRNNFNRAVQASDIEEPLPDWIANWYSWISNNHKENELMVKMLTNNIPPEAFFTRRRLLWAYISFGLLPQYFFGK